MSVQRQLSGAKKTKTRGTVRVWPPTGGVPGFWGVPGFLVDVPDFGGVPRCSGMFRCSWKYHMPNLSSVTSKSF